MLEINHVKLGPAENRRFYPLAFGTVSTVAVISKGVWKTEMSFSKIKKYFLNLNQ